MTGQAMGRNRKYGSIPGRGKEVLLEYLYPIQTLKSPPFPIRLLAKVPNDVLYGCYTHRFRLRALVRDRTIIAASWASKLI
jgi:hypothetical protein